MAELSNITYNLVVSPRIAESPSTVDEVTVQDALDTLSAKQDDIDVIGATPSVDNTVLVEGSGKDDLGGGVTVGITSTFDNLQWAFASDYTATSSGTATSTGTTTLIDSAGDFTGVNRGAVIINYTDKSITEVLTVDSVSGPAQLTHRTLNNGTANDWTIGDSYTIHNIVQKNLTGGNQVAVDSAGSSISPVYPTAFTQIILTASSSATLQDLELTELKYQIESLRESHAGYGDIYFVDPVNGSDSASGESPTTPVMTLQYAHDSLVTDGNHDIVFILGASITIDETLLFTKSDFSVRGAGSGTVITPTSTLAHTLDVQGDRFHLQAVKLNIAAGSTYRPLNVTANYFWGEGIEIQGQAQGMYISDSFGSTLTRNCKIHGASADHNITVGDNVSHFVADDIHLCSANKSNIKVIGTTGVWACAIRGRSCIQNAGEYGLDIDSGSLFTIYPEVMLHNNTLGDINDNATKTATPHTREIREMLGLDKQSPMTITPTAHSSNNIDIVISGDGETESILTRQ